MAAEAKSKIFALFTAKMRELEECEMKSKKGEISIEEGRASFMSLSATLDTNERHYRTPSMCSSSTSTSEGSDDDSKCSNDHS